MFVSEPSHDLLYHHGTESRRAFDLFRVRAVLAVWFLGLPRKLLLLEIPL